MAKEAYVSCEFVQRVIQEASWRSLRKVKVPLISKKGREARIEQATGLVNALKSAPPGRILFFFRQKDICDRPIIQSSKGQVDQVR